MITLTRNQARAICQNRDLIANLVQGKLSFRTAYSVRKILDKIGQETQRFDQFAHDLQIDLAKRLAVKREDGAFETELPEGATDDKDKIIKFTPENRAIASKEFVLATQEYGRQEFTIERDKVDLSGESVQVRMIDMPLMDLFVKDAEEPTPVNPQVGEPKVAEVVELNAPQSNLTPIA